MMTRELAKGSFLVWSLTSLFFICATSATSQTPLRAPSGLICELLDRPDQAVITDSQPEFGWIVNDSRRGARQSAYQILVASSEQVLSSNKGDLWDSGKVSSEQSINIEYAGHPLRAKSSYWWKVRTWDHVGKASPYSVPQRFITGDFDYGNRKWPGESRWVKLTNESGELWAFENRHPITYREIEPARVIRKSDDHYFVDLGKAAFATLKLAITSPNDAATVEIRLGEKLKEAQTIDQKPGGNINYKKALLRLRKGAHTYVDELPRQRSSYPNSQMLAAHMPEVTPFRYAEIVGAPSELRAADVRQLGLFYKFDDAASAFNSSNKDLDAVWNLCKYTLKATPFLGIYADGTRERMPYEADAYIQQLGHYAVDREYAIARYTHEFLIFNPSWPTEWHLHSVLIAWTDYQYTGNTESLQKHYQELKAKTLLALAREDGLISTKTNLVTEDFLKTIHYQGKGFRDIVDWPQGVKPGEKKEEFDPNNARGETDGYVFTAYNTVVNAFHYRALVLMSEIALALNRTKEAEDFRRRAAVFKETFNKVFFDSARGIYVDGEGTTHSSLHANMFPLAFGLVPESNYRTVVEFIKSRGMACSPYGAQYLLEALYKEGEAQYALDLMTANTDRSWLNMLRIGSTMTTEAWDIKYKLNLDWNHAWGAAPANIIARKLMGVEPLAPAFKVVQIKPQPGKLAYAKIKTPTIRGTINCEWIASASGYQFNVSIPANTTARIYLPAQERRKVKEGSVLADKARGVKFLHMEDGFAVYETGGGAYSFFATH